MKTKIEHKNQNFKKIKNQVHKKTTIKQKPKSKFIQYNAKKKNIIEQQELN